MKFVHMVSRGPRMIAPSGPLVGRDPELDLLRRAVRRGSGGAGTSVVIDGEAGIGKTRLAGEVVVESRQVGAIVLQAAAREIERNRPFGVLLDALRTGPPDGPAHRVAGQIATGLSGTARKPGVASYWDAAGARSLSADAIVAALEAQASVRPTLLFLDDIDWADDGTVLVLHRLLPSLASRRLVVLMTCRHSQGRSGIHAIHADVERARGLSIDLGPLAEDAVASLTSSMLGGRPDPRLRDYLGRAAGHPLFLTELLHALSRDGVAVSGGIVRSEASVPPQSLRSLILGQLSYLPDPAWALLRVAAVFGATFPVGELAAVTGRGAFDLMASLSDAIRSGLIVEAGDSLAFRHALVRDAIYFDVPVALRSQLHRDVGNALREAGAAPTIVAVHLAQGAAHGDALAISSLRRAAASGDVTPSAAASYLAKALELTPPDSGDRAEISAELGIALIAAGRLRDAETILREEIAAAAHGPGTGQHATPVRLALSQALLLEGRLPESIEELLLAAGQTPPGSRAELEILADCSYREVLSGALDEGGARASHVLEQSSAAGADLAASTARLALAHERFYRGYLREAVALAQSALASARRLGSAEVASTIDADLGVFPIHVDQSAEAGRVLESGVTRAESTSAWQLPRQHYAIGYRAFYGGSWKDAVSAFDTGLRLARELQVGWWSTAVESSLAAIHVHRDDLRMAEQVLDGLTLDRPTSPDASIDYVLGSRAILAEARGDLALARRYIERAAGLVESWQLLPRYRRLILDLLRLSSLDSPSVRAAVEGLTTVAARSEVGSIDALATVCGGIVSGDRERILDGIARLDQTGHPLEYGVACEEAAIATSADRDVSRGLFAEAIAAYDRLGARRDRARAAYRARSLGLRLGAKHRHRPSGEGWRSITHAEWDVIRLVVDGLRNREIADRLYISPRTVEAHLELIYSKLGVRGRLELAVAAAQSLADARVDDNIIAVRP